MFTYVNLKAKNWKDFTSLMAWLACNYGSVGVRMVMEKLVGNKASICTYEKQLYFMILVRYEDPENYDLFSKVNTSQIRSIVIPSSNISTFLEFLKKNVADVIECPYKMVQFPMECDK